MKQVSIIGLFCNGQQVSDGQSIKTRIVTEELERALGAASVRRIDTFGWKKRPLDLLSRSILAVLDSRSVIFMTDEGGIKVFPWLLHTSNLLRRAKLHYVVIGGWLVPFLRKHSFLAACLKRLDCIFVETTVMRAGLEELGFRNVHLMSNCKTLTPLTPDQLIRSDGEPYRFCIFSRIMREKGVEDAVNAIRAVNARFGRTVCTLDLYGMIDPNQTDWFESLSASFPSCVRYGGVVPFDESVATLKNYHALLFPTKFYTEGVPGTIIDAYAAGVPVIASRWASWADVVEDNVTGITYPFSEPEQLTEILCNAVSDPDLLLRMKENCLRRAGDYLPENVMRILLAELA